MKDCSIADKRLFSLLPLGTVLLALGTGSGCQAWVVEDPVAAAIATQSAVPSATIATDATQTSHTLSPNLAATITLTPTILPTNPVAGPAIDDFPTSEFEGLGGVGIPPEILYFVAEPQEVEPGEEALLFWSAENADSAALSRLELDGSAGRTWDVPTEGSLRVTPRSHGRDEVYVLTVIGSGGLAEKQVFIQTSCPSIWFFEPGILDACPTQNLIATPALAQRFERGRMFWRADVDEIIIVYDGTRNITVNNPAWQIRLNPFQDGEQESDPSIVPPEGLLQPVRILGEVWRTVPFVRDRLGWATAPEVPYEMVIQQSDIDDVRQTYFSDETGAVLTLNPDKLGWSVVGFRSTSLPDLTATGAPLQATATEVTP